MSEEERLDGEKFLSPHFRAKELIPPGYWFHGRAVFDSRLFDMIEGLREVFGPLTANHGLNIYRGWRPRDCPIGAPSSYHKRGMALDFVPGYVHVTLDFVREYILSHQDEFPLVGGLEVPSPGKTMSWVHVDMRQRKNGKIVIFNG